MGDLAGPLERWAAGAKRGIAMGGECRESGGRQEPAAQNYTDAALRRVQLGARQVTTSEPADGQDFSILQHAGCVLCASYI